MFELSQLRCFVAVCEELHFGRAAARLNMTQPPLSRQIRLLEHQVGTQLLERSNRAVSFTAAGKAFLPEAVRILRLAEEASSTACRVAKGEQGSISIGYTATYGYALLPRIVERLRARTPSVSLTLKEMVTGSQLEALGADQLDVGFLRPHRQHGGLHTRVLGHERLLLAIPSREAGQWPAKPSLKALHERPMVMYSPYEALYFNQLVMGCLEAAGVRPLIVEYVAQIHTILGLVGCGIGAAVLPESAAQLGFDSVELRPLRTEPPRPVELVCAWRHDNENPILAILLRDILPGLARSQA